MLHDEVLVHLDELDLAGLEGLVALLEHVLVGLLGSQVAFVGGHALL